MQSDEIVGSEYFGDFEDLETGKKYASKSDEDAEDDQGIQTNVLKTPQYKTVV